MRLRFLTLIALTMTVLPAAGFSATAQIPTRQDRSIKKLTYPREPVEISGVKNKKKRIKLAEKFLDDDDWLDGFTVTIVNTSGKTITSLNIYLTFVRPPDHETTDDPPLGYPLYFNPSPFHAEYALRDPSRVVRPGESIDLVLRDDEYEGIKRFLKQLKYPRGSVQRLEIMIHTVGFEDGTAWGGGTTFHRDPDKPDKLVPDPEPIGRAQKRPADYFMGGYILTDAWAGTRFLKASHSRPQPPQSIYPCGLKIVRSNLMN